MTIIRTKSDAAIIAKSIANAITRPSAGEAHHLPAAGCLKPGTAGCAGMVGNGPYGEPPMTAQVLTIDLEPIYFWRYRSMGKGDYWYAQSEHKAIKFEIPRGGLPTYKDTAYPTVQALLQAVFGSQA